MTTAIRPPVLTIATAVDAVNVQPLTRSTLVVIDPSVADYLTLAAGVLPGAEVLMLDAHRDGIEQITQALQALPNKLQSLHLISHGAPGQIFLGDRVLSTATWPRYGQQLQRWSACLATGADILVYGCRVACHRPDRPDEPHLLTKLHHLTGANVAASTTPVGDAAQGGTWSLDASWGQVRTALALSPQAIATYPSVLGTITNLALIGSGTLADDTGVPNNFRDLSGITYNAADDTYLLVSDDASNPRIYTVQVAIDQAGNTVTPTHFNGTETSTALTITGGFAAPDMEGIALDNSGNLFISSEGAYTPYDPSNPFNLDLSTITQNPFIKQFDTDGTELLTLTLPAKFTTSSPTVGLRNNLALESLTLTFDNNYLFTAVEGPLKQDQNLGAFAANAPLNRIVRFDLSAAGVPSAEFLYEAELGHGLTELLALDNSGERLLAIERSADPSTGTVTRVQLFEVDLTGATDISGTTGLNGNTTGITSAAKTQLADFSNASLPGLRANYEGVTFGPTLPDGRRSLVLVSDNNNVGDTRFTAFAVDETTPLVAIAATDAVKAEGNGGTTNFSFIVTRSGDTSSATSVDFAVAGNVDAADFGGTLPTGTVNFAIGETATAIEILVSGDTELEFDEDFTVTLSNASGDAVITTATAAGTLQNDDAASNTVIISEILYNAASSEATTATQFIELLNVSDSPISLNNWTLDDEDADGPNTLPNVTLAPGAVAVITGSTTAAFAGAWGAATGYTLISLADLGQTMFNLANAPSDTSEIIALRDAANTLIDVVNYDDASDWPADPGGFSIYLTPGNLDATSNDSGANWALSATGTDGAFTSTAAGVWNAPEVGSPGVVGGSGGANNAPVLSATLASTTYTDTASDDTFTDATGSLSTTDPDVGDSATYGITDGTDNGDGTVSKIGTYGTLTVDQASGAYTFTPDDGAIEGLTADTSEVFNLTVTDGAGASDSETLTINLTGVNDAPSFTKGINQTVLEDAGAQTVTGWATAIQAGPANEANQNLIFKVSNDNNPLFAVQPAIDSTTGNLTYTPAPDANGSATVTVTLSDDGGTANGGADTSSQETFVIGVNSVNDTPQAVDDYLEQTSKENEIYAIAFASLLANDRPGPDNESAENLTITAVSNAIGGTVKIQGTDVLFTPTSSYQGVPSFDYTVQDDGTTSGTADPQTATATAFFGVKAKPTQAQVTVTSHRTQRVSELVLFTTDDANGTVNQLKPGDAGYQQAALDRALPVMSILASGEFSALNQQHMVDLSQSQFLQFAVLTGGTLDDVRRGGSANVLFANGAANSNGQPGAIATAIDDQTSEISFRLPGSRDFGDLVIRIKLGDFERALGDGLQGQGTESELIDLTGLATPTVNVTIHVRREASYNNTVGFYTVENAQGSIIDPVTGNTLNPGDNGYLKAAVANHIGLDLVGQNDTTTTYRAKVATGHILSTFLVVDGGISALLDDTPTNDPTVYFNHIAANADNTDHVRLLGTHTFGYEDLPGGGDMDFNDVIVSWTFN